MILPIANEIDIGGQQVIYLSDVIDTSEYQDCLFYVGDARE